MIYCDSAATTKISDEVLQSMKPYLTTNYGNASSLYSFGSKCHKAIDKARERVAKAIGVKPSEIYFTSGGSESDNWAIVGHLKNTHKKEIITTEFEHPAVYNTCKYLESVGYKVTYIKPDKYGIIHSKDIENAITDNTALVSVMTVNNEIGTIQPIKEIGTICKKYNIPFHTDAVQAIGHIPIDVNDMNIDMLSLSGHKFHAPKGIGALYVREGLKFSPLIYGGEQERGLRAGTENVANIVGFGKAIEICNDNLLEEQTRIKKIRDALVLKLISKLSKITDIKFNGSNESKIANNISITINGCSAESLVLLLDIEGICVSAGSACSSSSGEVSRTLKSIGLNDEETYSTIRISLSNDVTVNDIDIIAEKFERVVSKIIDVKERTNENIGTRPSN